MKIQHNPVFNTSDNISRRLKKLVISATAFTTLTLGIGVPTLAELKLKTVYYVYVDDQFVGIVSEKDLVDQVIEEKIKASEDQNQDLNLTVGPKLNLIPEQVFESVLNTDDKKVSSQLEQLLSIEAVAAEILFDDGVSIFVKDKEAAEKVMAQLKLEYVTEEQLEEVETKKNDTNNSLAPSKENETRLLDVRLSKNVAVSDKKITPDQILTVEQAVDYLLKGTLEEKKYAIKEGDVLGLIANDHGMPLKQLLSLNPGIEEDSLLKIGQELNVTVLEPLVEVVVDKEVFKTESIPFKKEVVEDSTMFKGDNKVKQEGKEGLKEVVYKVSEKNGTLLHKEVLSEKILEEAKPQIIIKGTKVMPSRGDGTFAWPAVGGYISSKQGQRWGKLHKGIDIARPSGPTIKAADNGKVVFAGWSGGYGNKVVIDHQNGFETVYAHLSSISVSVGQTVTRGMKLGNMGSTGNSTGVHLHFEIYKNGNLENPLNYIR